MNSKKTVDPLQKYLSEPADHPFADLIRGWLDRGNLPYQKCETEMKNGIRWNFSACQPAHSFHLDITKLPSGNCSFTVDIALANLPVDRLGTIKEYLLKQHHRFHTPFRFALHQSGIISLQWSMPCSAITAEYFQEMLDSVEKMVQCEFADLQKEFGLAPFVAPGSKENGPENKGGSSVPPLSGAA